MHEPNFSESQLQQAVNTAYIRHAYEIYGEWVFANVPSLVAEYHLGWDTAFHFPWHPHPPLPDQEGCNFFIQYKLSIELTSAGAKEWEYWNAQYFRFKIPHGTISSAGRSVNDYHQWDRLKTLADKGYPTFYATNATLRKDDLRTALEAGTLLNDVPVLDVRDMEKRHKHVTFTASSDFFLLHSEKEQLPRISFSAAIERLPDNRVTSLERAGDLLLREFREIAGPDEGWYEDLQRIAQLQDRTPRGPDRAWLTQMLLSSFAKRHFGVQLLWLPMAI